MAEKEVRAVSWLALLGAKFAWVVPFRTSLVVLLTLFSQIAHLLAFFLPLKIVILLGSDGIPRYFPPSFAQLDRDFLVVVLGIATVGFFFAHTLAERLIDVVTRSAARLLIERNKKLVLFENQDQVAEVAYQGFARALAGLVFCLLTLIALAWIYPEMALVMAGYLLLSTILVVFFCSYSEQARAWIEANLNSLMANISALGFFTVFGYLVIDFVLLQPPGVLVAILSILAGRQSFGRVAAAANGLYRIYGQREKLDAIFFHGRPLVQAVIDERGSFWQYLTPESRVKWGGALLQEFCDIKVPSDETISEKLKWQQPATPNTGALIYRQQGKVWMLKLFAQKSGSAPRHEATLLADPPNALPAPEFKGASEYDAFPCSIYQLPPGKPVSRQRHGTARLQVYAKLLSIEVPRPFVKRYIRSKSILPQRMNATWLDRLDLAVVNPRQRESTNGLKQYWQEWQSLLAALPLVIHNPTIKPGLLWQAEPSGELLILHWERWSLEPAGAGWPVGSRALERLREACHEARAVHKAFDNCLPEHLVIAALTYELEQHIRNQKLDMAIETATRIWKTLESCLKPEAQHDHTL